MLRAHASRAPVRDQSVIVKIKETVANGAESDAGHICIFATSDSQGKRERGRKQRGREGERF